jgi:hypothetical protein
MQQRLALPRRAECLSWAALVERFMNAYGARLNSGKAGATATRGAGDVRVLDPHLEFTGKISRRHGLLCDDWADTRSFLGIAV